MRQEWFDRIRLPIVVLACMINVLAVIAFESPTDPFYFRSTPLNYRPLEDRLFEAVVNYGIWLAPAMAVILLRKYAGVAAAYIIALIPICLRAIYVAGWMTPYYGHYQKGDWSSWALTGIGFGSLLVIAVLALLQIVIFIQNITDRNSRRL